MLAASLTASDVQKNEQKPPKHIHADVSRRLSAVLPGWGQAEQDVRCGKLILFMANFPSSC